MGGSSPELDEGAHTSSVAASPAPAILVWALAANTGLNPDGLTSHTLTALDRPSHPYRLYPQSPGPTTRPQPYFRGST